MKKLAVVLTVLLGGCAGLPTSSEYIARGEGYLKDGKPVQAVDMLNKAVALNPNNLDAYEARGAAYFYKGQYDLAEKDFARILEEDPYRFQTYTAYASVLAARGNFEQALTVLNWADALRPNQAETYFARAGVYYMLGKYDLAVADYTRTLQLRRSADVLTARGTAYAQWGKPEQAQQDFQAAQTENIPQYLNVYSRMR